MKEIKLTHGLIALVDDEDFEKVNAFKWYPSKEWNTFYAIHCFRIDGNRKNVRMHYNKDRKKFVSSIKHNYKTIALGRFDSEIDAAKAYDLKAKELFGEFAYLNFNP